MSRILCFWRKATHSPVGTFVVLPPASCLCLIRRVFDKITVVGVGLLGGSLGLAIKQRKLARRVEGYVRRESSIAECQRFGVLDRATCDLASAVSGADLVILCTPLAQMRDLATRMLSALKSGAIVTDVGSVKGTVVSELELLVNGAGFHFIGSHPMAGGEKTGVSAARSDLFNNAICVVTPTKQSNPAALRKVEDFWKAIGSRILTMSPELHDELVARSSHLPHVVAAELASYVLSPGHPKDQSSLCANGFRDTTRVASGSPEMWRDIALANQKNLSEVLRVYIDGLETFRRALEAGNNAAVEQFFAQAKQRRDEWRARAESVKAHNHE